MILWIFQTLPSELAESIESKNHLFIILRHGPCSVWTWARCRVRQWVVQGGRGSGRSSGLHRLAADRVGAPQGNVFRQVVDHSKPAQHYREFAAVQTGRSLNKERKKRIFINFLPDLNLMFRIVNCWPSWGFYNIVNVRDWRLKTELLSGRKYGQKRRELGPP